jgi:tetratricopeptide (TPR) repeat protein
LLLGLLCLFCVSLRANASEKGWALLAANDYEGALEETLLLSDTGSALASGLAYTALGKDDQAAQIWLALLPEVLRFGPERPWKGLLFFLEQLNTRNDLDQSLADRYIEILGQFPDLSPAARQALWQKIHRIALKSGIWQRAEEAAREIGWIRCWQWVAGPFAYSGAEDFEEVFGPERDLTAASWSTAGRTLARIPLSSPQRLGSINLEDYLYPPAGVAYCFARFSVSQPGAATLLLDCGDSARVWVNGLRVLERDAASLDLENPKSATCELRAGANWILVKCLKASASLNFRLALQREGQPVAIEPAEGVPEPSAVNFVAALPSEEADEKPKPSPDTALLDALLHWGAAADVGRWPEAEGALLGLLESHPDFALGRRFLGETYLMESGSRPGSRDRLEKQAQEQFARALAGCPVDAVAAQLASNYHLSRQTLDAAAGRPWRAVPERNDRTRVGCRLLRWICWLQRGRDPSPEGFLERGSAGFSPKPPKPIRENPG